MAAIGVPRRSSRTGPRWSDRMARDMDALTNLRSTADLRDYLAEERTFLAWIRTGIALMGLGFVLSHFGLSGDRIVLTADAPIAPTDTLALMVGVALIGVGVIVNLLAARRYIRLVGALRRGLIIERAVSKEGVSVAMFLALLGVAVTTYMLVVVTPVPNAQNGYPPLSIGDDHGKYRDAVLRV